ncbi:MAG: helix-turn-helix domain-containing protein [Sulfolobaceae archaeon]
MTSEKPFALSEVTQRVLIVLGRENRGLTVRELVEKTDTNSGSIKRALEELIELKLIKEERENVFPYRRLISFTELGKEVAKRVIEIEELIKKVRTNG